MVSLISLVLALRHRTLPASLHVEEQNEFIEWAGSPFYVNRATRPWESPDGRPLTGAVSAFGLSGTNAHLVVSQYAAEPAPAAAPAAAAAPYHLLLVSARTEDALRERIGDLVRVLADEEADIGAVAYTLMAGRRHLDHRVAVIAADRAEALERLRAAAEGERSPAVVRGQVPRGFEGTPAIRRYGEELVTRRRDPLETLQALADLYCQGYDLDWGGLYDAAPRRVNLPGYPFAPGHPPPSAARSPRRRRSRRPRKAGHLPGPPEPRTMRRLLAPRARPDRTWRACAAGCSPDPPPPRPPP